LLSLVGIPDPKSRMGVFPHQLSGGLRQRVMIAMAVAGGPKLIVADEPTTALDVTVQAQVLKLLRSLREEVGCSVLMITHDLGVAAQVADRVAVVYAGRLAEIGTTAEVLQSPAHPYTRGLLRSRLSLESDRTRQLVAMPGDLPSSSAWPAGCAFYSRCDVATDACASTRPEPAAVGAGHLSACLLGPAGGTTNRTIAPEPIGRPQRARGDAPPVLRMEHLEKSFKIGIGNRLQALRGVDLTIAPGESVALVGESGSGKTTLLRVAAGLEIPDNGKLELHSEIRPQMIFQDAGASLTPWLTIEQILGERVRSLGRRQRAGKVADALALVGLPPEAAKAKPYQLSGGQRQRVALARATIVPSKLLLCDEPTSALDVSLAASVINLIGRLRRELDMSVLFVTHDLSVARIVADRIAVMYLGRIVEVGASEQMAAAPAHPYTKALISAVPDVGREPVILAGEPASPLRPPAGCAFHPRCPQAKEVCSDTDLDVKLVGSSRDALHWIACMNPIGAQTSEVA
jgi:peptide/nickel transport system ATP-binding protein